MTTVRVPSCEHDGQQFRTTGGRDWHMANMHPAVIAALVTPNPEYRAMPKGERYSFERTIAEAAAPLIEERDGMAAERIDAARDLRRQGIAAPSKTMRRGSERARQHMISINPNVSEGKREQARALA